MEKEMGSGPVRWYDAFIEPLAFVWSVIIPSGLEIPFISGTMYTGAYETGSPWDITWPVKKTLSPGKKFELSGMSWTEILLSFNGYFNSSEVEKLEFH